MIKKWLLYITGFFSGMSVMAIELGASRLLAPYFSSSQIVWTIVIGTIMIAMAMGNVIGGKMADKHKNPSKLFTWLFIDAIFIALIPLFGKFVIAGVALLLALIVKSNYLIWAAFVSCLLLFVFPLLILGMVTPNLVKFALNDDTKESGKTVGIIEALNTIGSIIGTFLPTFVTIPNVGTAWTFVIFSTILLIICLIYVILKYNKKEKDEKKNKKFIIKTTSCILVAILALSLGGASSKIKTAFWANNTKYEGESIYNYLRVEETDDAIILSTNVLFGVQSMKMKTPGLTRMYYDYALASPIMANGTSKHLDILILGLGTGTFATQCSRYFSDVSIEGVEIDQKIVDLAYQYFDMNLADENVYVTDGRAFLDQCDKKYDVIMVDAYQDITIPFQMSSIEFFQKVNDHLNENGNMIVNMNMYTSKEGSINDYLQGTISQVFDSVYVVKCNTTSMELYASNNYNVKEALEKNIQTIDKYELKNMMNIVLSNLEEIKPNGYILTDDKAPVELLGMKVLDELIFDEINYYKEQIKGKSLKEIYEMFVNGEIF